MLQSILNVGNAQTMGRSDFGGLSSLETALPPTKSSRENAVHSAGGKLIIDQTRAIAEYEVTEFSVCNGRAFRLVKVDGGTDRTELAYSVFIPTIQAEASGDVWPECDCKGFARTGRCKHVDAVRAVLDRGMMPKPIVKAVAKPVRMCCDCGKKPTDGIGYRCSGCEGRM